MRSHAFSPDFIGLFRVLREHMKCTSRAVSSIAPSLACVRHGAGGAGRGTVEDAVGHSGGSGRMRAVVAVRMAGKLMA